ncbi:hypothetical protein OV079_51160 [Nannocystis pusilla]|uniref:Uncharacterized protein n=1 Tax=Nannocystis pusilla TaxID=889268 RepID=A0A9X3J3G4_9BACT|nr:hypothetical protein [Nannocystis pusilla]MCY1013751.1 hypothetical protein [Nannocystis pusilla]
MPFPARVIRYLVSILVWTLGFAWMTGVILFLVGFALVRGGGLSSTAERRS